VCDGGILTWREVHPLPGLAPDEAWMVSWQKE